MCIYMPVNSNCNNGKEKEETILFCCIDIYGPMQDKVGYNEKNRTKLKDHGFAMNLVYLKRTYSFHPVQYM